MTIQIAVGDESFEDVRRSGLYYVDKTELLYELVEGAKNKVTLFTRPRRFGKTLGLSMMESFFDIERDSSDVFAGLDVTDHAEFCDRWMNRYPVLSISFKDVDGLDFDTALMKLGAVLADACKKHARLASSKKANKADVEVFERLMYQRGTMVDIQNSLKTIMRMMMAEHGRPVVLLIDEYDVPLSKASEKNAQDMGFYKRMLDVVKGMLSIALKTNEYLKFAVITGCLRIAKESVFTGTNNFASYSVLDNRFSRYFGFTQEEVDLLLGEAGLCGKADVFRAWYDGYLFGDTEVYCPWDVASYASALLYDHGAPPRNYWRNTSGNGVVREFVGREDLDVSDEFEALMNGDAIWERVTDELTYDTLGESEENLWSILLHTGYLTATGKAATDGRLELRIPNAEIDSIFEDAVVGLFSDTIDLGRQRGLMNALWAGDEEAASAALSDFLWDTISFHDYHEDYYHAFLAGIFVGLGYAVDSNRESGLGRFDIRVKDRKNHRMMIIEAKKALAADVMPEACEEALRQVAARGYERDVEPGYECIRSYGISFFRKTAMVKLMPNRAI